jgi:ATP-dependent DNA helicase RecG
VKESQRKIVILQRQTVIMMTPEKLKAIISQGEGTEVELKESKDSLARKVYESISAFLNRRGGLRPYN